MLQRFVRSSVRTEPRPCLMVLLPWWWSFSSLWARMSRPGKTSSRCLKNARSTAMTSSKCPWMGQSLIIQISPSRSTIWALISPTFSSTRVMTSPSPFKIFSRASGIHFGHSESVVRGHPRVGLVFCQDLRSGLSDQAGVNVGFGLIRLRRSKMCHAPFAATETAFSTYLMGRCIVLSRVDEYTESRDGFQGRE